MLNKTQQNILDGTLKFLFEAIREVQPALAIKAFELILSLKVSSKEGNFFVQLDIFDSIKQLREILEHPYPQNRSTSTPYLGQIPGYAVYEPNGHGKGWEKEPLGLLSLTARNDGTAPPITRKDVVDYIVSQIKKNIREIKLEQQLHQACETKDLLRVSTLLQDGVDPNANGENQFKPLHIAAKNGSINLAEILIKAGADLKQKNSFGDSPVYWAASMGNVDVLNFFFSQLNDINLNETNESNKTALMGAISGGHLSVIECLIKHGLRSTAEDVMELISDNSAELAKNRHNIFKILISNAQFDENEFEDFLLGAAKYKRFDILRYLLARSASVDDRLGKLAEDDQESKNSLGFRYKNGLDSTARWLARASFERSRKKADQGDAFAKNLLGDMCCKDISGFEKDYSLAFYWYREGANQGDSCAQNSLGQMYLVAGAKPQPFKA
jgi:ankyrin repeat protein